jgi:hypothetical protein
VAAQVIALCAKEPAKHKVITKTAPYWLCTKVALTTETSARRRKDGKALPRFKDFLCDFCVKPFCLLTGQGLLVQAGCSIAYSVAADQPQWKAPKE